MRYVAAADLLFALPGGGDEWCRRGEELELLPRGELRRSMRAALEGVEERAAPSTVLPFRWAGRLRFLRVPAEAVLADAAPASIPRVVSR